MWGGEEGVSHNSVIIQIYNKYSEYRAFILMIPSENLEVLLMVYIFQNVGPQPYDMTRPWPPTSICV